MKRPFHSPTSLSGSSHFTWPSSSVTESGFTRWYLTARIIMANEKQAAVAVEAITGEYHRVFVGCEKDRHSRVWLAAADDPVEGFAGREIVGEVRQDREVADLAHGRAATCAYVKPPDGMTRPTSSRRAAARAICDVKTRGVPFTK